MGNDSAFALVEGKVTSKKVSAKTRVSCRAVLICHEFCAGQYR